MRALVTTGGGFLLAVLWFDLMFDIQLRRYPRFEVPEDVIESIARYYRRVTTDARPMNRLVALMMLVVVGSLLLEVFGVGDVPRGAAVVSLLLALVAIGTAGSRTVPRAVRLGSRADPLPEQMNAARAIFREHVFCLGCVSLALVIQLLA